MRDMNRVGELDRIENAMAAFIANAVTSKRKLLKIRRNMECRRQIELKRDEKRLQKELSEYEFC